MTVTFDPPAIGCKSEVTLYEQHDVQTREFLRSLFTYFDPDDHVWIGENAAIGKKNLTVQDLEAGLRLVADHEAFPEVPPDITLAPSARQDDHFVKRPQVHHLFDRYTAALVPQILLEEVGTLEMLRKSPHRSIVPYYGCVVKRGRITGIVLQRYASILDHRFLFDSSTFNVSVFEEDLKAAVRHIHALGVAHNDINPSNIALDQHDRPILIDWGSCKEFGAQLVSAGTPGWIDDDYDISKQDHDVKAVDKVVQWVKEQKML